MEELDLTQIYRYYLRKLPIIILFIILFILLGYYYNTYIQVPMYRGTTTIILVPKSNTKDTNDTESEIKINEKLVSTYSEIIKSRRVLEQVKEKLKLKTSIKSLADQIEISSIETTAIIEIVVSDTDNTRATEIANEVAEVFKKEISEIYNLENISIIDKAIIEKKPYNINNTKQMIIFAFGGIVLSCGLIFIMYYFDNSIKTKEEIEEKLNLAVIGEIPSAKKLDKNRKKNNFLKRITKFSKSKNPEQVKKTQQEQKEPTKKKTTSPQKHVSKKASPKKAPTTKTTTKKQNKTKEEKVKGGN